MKKIGLVCAFPTVRNTGMITVDLAANRLADPAFGSNEITRYVLSDPQQLSFDIGELPFSYRPIVENLEELWSKDLIIFWGDFTNAASYWNIDVMPRLLKHNLAGDAAEALELLYKYYLFEGAPPDVLKKTILFGGTILTNTSVDLSNERYAVGVERLISHARRVLFRDAISSARASCLRAHEPTLGIDCAFLLRDSDLRKLNGYGTLDGGLSGEVGVFYGRTPAAGLGPMLAFARHLSSALQYKPRWLPWFAARRRTRWLAKVAGFSAPQRWSPPGSILSELSGYSLVVTDTYHLCVNAWRMGIPTVCIGSGTTHDTSTVGDKKKEVLYAMYGAQPFYVFNEELHSPMRFQKATARVAAAIKIGASKQVTAAIRKHEAVAVERLLAALDN